MIDPLRIPYPRPVGVFFTPQPPAAPFDPVNGVAAYVESAGSFRSRDRYAAPGRLYRYGQPWGTGGFTLPTVEEIIAPILAQSRLESLVYGPSRALWRPVEGPPWVPQVPAAPFDPTGGVAAWSQDTSRLRGRDLWRETDPSGWVPQTPAAPFDPVNGIAAWEQATESFRARDRYEADTRLYRLGHPWSTGGFTLPLVTEIIAGIISDHGERTATRRQRWLADVTAFLRVPEAPPPFDPALYAGILSTQTQTAARRTWGLWDRWTPGGFSVPNPEDFIAAMTSQMESFRAPERNQRWIVQQPDLGWIFHPPFDPTGAVAALAEMHSFRMPRRLQRWIVDQPEDGWIFSGIPAFDPTVTVAVNALLGSFRARERAQQWIVDPPVTPLRLILPDLHIPPTVELAGSFLLRERLQRLIVDQPSQAWIFAAVPPFNPTAYVAASALLGSFRLPKREQDFHALLTQPFFPFFPYIPPAQVPILLAISPASVFVGTGPLILTLTGQFFETRSIALFNGVPRATVFVDSNTLLASLPATDTDDIGVFPVSVFTSAPGGGTSNALPFTVLTRRRRGGWKWERDRFGAWEGKGYAPNVLTIGGPPRRNMPQKK